ncbi:MAG TPA: PepSY-associated TM helix domain-containing protein [Ilumatobacter sp.]|nr:PepSY-associated TM helix domain-containing protein [Ilumatobacter sp.]
MRGSSDTGEGSTTSTAVVEGIEVSTDHWIGGRRVPSPATFTDVSPIDEQPIAEVARGGGGEADQAVTAARAATGLSQVRFMAFPGNDFATPHHFVAFMNGDSPVTSRLMTPVLIDGETSVVIDQRPLTGITKALLISQPLHFGDYGGLPLKILWALFDLIAIVVLSSGVYLWWKKRKLTIEQRFAPASPEAAP